MNSEYKPDEYRQVQGVVVRKSFIGSGCDTTYSAWRKLEGPVFGKEGYSTVTQLDGQWYGKVGTEPVPPMVKTDMEWRQWLTLAYHCAYSLITLAFPEAAYGQRCMGEIDCHVS